MELKKSQLEDDLEKIFNVDKKPKTTGPADTANKIISAVEKYLSPVKLNMLAAPGINPAGVPDPAFAPSDLVPINPIKLPGTKAALTGLLTAGSPSWAALAGTFTADMAAAATWMDMQGYTAVGAVATPPIILDPALISGMAGAGSKEVAKSMANIIHAGMATSTYTGAYTKAAFVGPAPHVSPLK